MKKRSSLVFDEEHRKILFYYDEENCLSWSKIFENIIFLKRKSMFETDIVYKNGEIIKYKWINK